VLAGRWPLTLIPFTYIAAVTVVSRGEVHGGKRGAAALALISLGGVVAALAAIAAAAGAGRRVAAGAVAALLAVRVLPPFWRVYRDPAPAGIRHAVRTGVLSLVLVDATLGAAYAGPLFGAVVLATAVVAAGLARLFAVT
jgi:4-hydroxybenzoate polyprenyltransferase